MEATMKTRRLFIVTVLFLLCAVAVAQPKPRLLDKETFMDMESVGNPEISPDGKQIIFTRTWVDKVKDQYRSNLWIVDFGRAQRFLAGLVARRQADRVSFGPRRDESIARDVARHARNRAAHPSGTGAERHQMVARRKAGRLHFIRTRQRPDPPHQIARTPARRRMGQTSRDSRPPLVGFRRPWPRAQGPHARLRH